MCKRNYPLKITFLDQLSWIIALVLLLLFIFYLDPSSATSFMKILMTFLISTKIINNYFSPILKINLSNNTSIGIYEYILSIVFAFFIFMGVEFILNEMYWYVYLAFISLLIFSFGIAFLVEKMEHKNSSSQKMVFLQNES